jgi:hypothetical protein
MIIVTLFFKISSIGSSPDLLIFTVLAFWYTSRPNFANKLGAQKRNLYVVYV